MYRRSLAGLVLIGLLSGAGLLVAAPSALAADYQFWYTKPYCLPSHKVFRETPAPAGARKASEGRAGLPYLELAAARSEFEGRQIAVRPLSNLAGFWVEPGDLSKYDASGRVVAQIPATEVSAYWVYYVYVRKRSYGVYGYRVPGYFPDALPPFRLADGRLKKIGSPAGRTQPVYVLFHVPESAPAGYYTGEVTLHAEDTPDVRIPVRLRVYDFSVARASIRTSFGLSLKWAKYTNSPQHTWYGVGDTGYCGNGYYRMKESTKFGGDAIARWLKFMKDHRVSPQTLAVAWGWVDSTGHTRSGPMPSGYMPKRAGYLEDALWSGQATTHDGSRFNFDTGHMPDGSYKLTYVRSPFSSNTNRIKAATHYRSLRYALWPWRHKSVIYVVDEPSTSQRYFVERYGAFVHTYARGFPFMVTIDPARFGYRRFRNVDIYVNKLHFWWRDRSRWINPLWKSGRKVWQYSHSTNHQRIAPLYLVDKSTVDSRIQGWLAWKTRADGLMYFYVNRWQGPRKTDKYYQDPYRYTLSCIIYDGGLRILANGEGQLIYPGFYQPLGLNVVGAPPVSSLRMEALRDGLEDYEYLKALERKYRSKGKSDWWVRKMVSDKLAGAGGGFPGFPWYSKSATRLESLRDGVGREVER